MRLMRAADAPSLSYRLWHLLPGMPPCLCAGLAFASLRPCNVRVDYSAVAVAAPSPHSSDAPSRCSRSAIRERCRAFDTPTAAVFEVIEKVLPSVLVLQLTSADCLAQQMESLGMGML